MYTSHKEKKVSFNESEFKRRIIQGTYQTLPYGYI